MNNPKVSLLIPIYNVASYIERCAVSLFEQTYDNIEYIFVNDCTSDDSISVLLKVILRYPKLEGRIKILHHERNRGLAAARNTAVMAATGDFVMHIDSDDWIDSHTVEECLNEQKRTGADIVSFEAVAEWEKNQDVMRINPYKSKEDKICQMLEGSMMHCVWGSLILRRIYTNHHIRQMEGINMGEDYIITPILHYYATSIAVIHTPFYHYSIQNENSYVHGFSQKKGDELWKAIEIAEAFFADKNPSYKKAINDGKVAQIMDYMIKSLQHHCDAYYEVCCQRLSQLQYIDTTRLCLKWKLIYYLKYKWIRQFYVSQGSPIWYWFKYHMKLKRINGNRTTKGT